MKTLEQLNFKNSYAELPDIFYSSHAPQPLRDSFLIHGNAAVARLLGLNPDELKRDSFLDLMGGEHTLPGMSPLAMCYAGHQFGHLVPRLGDGRAILLGQVETVQGNKWDLQLKGAGKTLYSRDGDGRAVLRSSIREYLCSAAMHGLGIATSHALFLSGSQEEVYRESIETGAMILRVAQSHIRFGSFEYFFYSQRYDDLKTLFDYVIEQHYPQLKPAENQCLEFFKQVVSDTAEMIANWQSVGFCHGVMNTDNMSIHGITLDYGPFAFLDKYQAGFVCNHSDYQGRYAFNKQPEIGLFNLSCLAQALLPLFHEDIETAVQIARSALDSYQTAYITSYASLMRAKLGFVETRDDDQALLEQLLLLLEQNHVDYTLFFRHLSAMQTDEQLASITAMFQQVSGFDDWLQQYKKRLQSENMDKQLLSAAMKKVNPKYILRNYLAETAIRKARDNADYTMIDELMTVLQAPYDEHPQFEAFAAEPPDWAGQIEISCSS